MNGQKIHFGWKERNERRWTGLNDVNQTEDTKKMNEKTGRMERVELSVLKVSVHS